MPGGGGFDELLRELKDLFRQIGRGAVGMELLALNQVALDGTRVRANSSRSSTATAATLEQRVAVLDEQIEQIMEEADKVDSRENDLFGEGVSGTTLPRKLRDVKRRQELLRRALAAAQKADAANPKRKRAAKVPVADPDSGTGQPAQVPHRRRAGCAGLTDMPDGQFRCLLTRFLPRSVPHL